jgi:hypothetical protein
VSETIEPFRFVDGDKQPVTFTVRFRARCPACRDEVDVEAVGVRVPECDSLVEALEAARRENERLQEVLEAFTLYPLYADWVQVSKHDLEMARAIIHPERKQE